MHTIGIDIRPLITTPYTGVGEYTRELLSAIFKQDHINTYYLYYNSLSTIFKQPTSWNQENVHLVSTFYPNKIFNSALKLLNRPYIDRLIIKNYTEQHPQPISNCVDFFFSPNINFTSLSSATKHILTVHDLSFRFFPKFFSKKQQLWHTLINPQKQYKKADLLITPSENTKQDLVNHLHINPDKIKVIYPGISYEFRKEISDDQLTYVKNHYHLPDKFILFLGTIEPRKNILGLIKAFELIYKLILPHCSLVIAGGSGWKNKKIYEYIQCSPAKEHIKVIGYIETQHKPCLYKLASLFVYPSFYEGFGFPVVEAMASGIPVITANRSSLPEVTEHNAYLINPHDPRSIAQGILRINNNHELKNRLIQGGLSQGKKFNWDNAAKEWLENLW